MNSTAMTTAGAVYLGPINDAKRQSDADGFAISIAATKGSGPAASGAVGASVADNEIGKGAGQFVRATIENSAVNAAGDVSLSASSTATIEALTIGGSAAGSGSSGSGVSGARAGRGAG